MVLGASHPGVSAQSRATRILARVRAIPEGFVATYGDIDPRAPRLVGQVLAGHPGGAEDSLPWHRVVRADGTATQGGAQRARLRREGVPMRGERVDLRRARVPPDAGR
ncbi:MAG TPA: MGMT family protein [Solirubrobacteraceae bacterium]|jgi:alkylated DNA nucleotide flippase Atl1|nr:MGMT family protein [Solirubrobacteraceae bacterium]